VDAAGSLAIQGLECNSAFGAGYEFRDGRAQIDVNITKSGFIDRTGNVVIPPEFKSVEPFAEGLAPAAKAGEAEWGYLDISGHWAIQPRFEWAFGFSDGLALVQMKGSCGYIDRSGTVILQPADITTDCWPSLGHFSEGLASKLKSGKYGFMDRTGKVVIPEQFDQVKPFAEGMAAVLIGKDWGYIDQSGRMAVPPRSLQKAESFHNGLAKVVTADGKEGYLDQSGKYVWTPTRTEKD